MREDNSDKCAQKNPVFLSSLWLATVCLRLEAGLSAPPGTCEHSLAASFTLKLTQWIVAVIHGSLEIDVNTQCSCLSSRKSMSKIPVRPSLARLLFFLLRQCVQRLYSALMSLAGCFCFSLYSSSLPLNLSFFFCTSHCNENFFLKSCFLERDL